MQAKDESKQTIFALSVSNDIILHVDIFQGSLDEPVYRLWIQILFKPVRILFSEMRFNFTSAFRLINNSEFY